MFFNEIQKKIIKDMLNFKVNGYEIRFKELFEEILEKNFKNFGIIITKDDVYIKSSEIIKDKNKLYELFFLIESLTKTHLIKFIKTGKDIEKEVSKYKYNIYEEKNDLVKINLNKQTIKLIYDNLYSDYYISSNLREIKKMGFKSIEEKNLKYTLIALWASIVISILGFAVQYLIAKNINTVVEFENPEQLRNSSITILNIYK